MTLGNQHSVPTPKGIGCYQGTDLLQDLAADRFGFGRQPATLPVVEFESLLAEQFMERSIFVHEKGDAPVLILGKPASQADDQEIEFREIHGALCLGQGS